MADSTLGVVPVRPVAPLRISYIAAAGLGFAIMIAALLSPSLWFLNFVHVMAGGLWTGIDLFMGFVVGPVLRGVSFDARRAIISGLVPRTLILMPTLSIITSTAGWFLAVRMGYLDLGYPEFCGSSLPLRSSRCSQYRAWVICSRPISGSFSRSTSRSRIRKRLPGG